MLKINFCCPHLQRCCETVYSMNRFALNEMSMERFTSALMRRVHDLPHLLAWDLPFAFARQNRKHLSKFSNKHPGQRCFILANGPSLARMDLSPLRSEITFGLNRIYLLFDKLDFGCTYYVSVNELVLRQFAADIAGLRMPKFINWNLRSLFDVTDANTMFVRVDLNLVDKFARNVSSLVYSGGTVTFVALQLAYFMGFTEVVLVGLDHSFVD